MPGQVRVSWIEIRSAQQSPALPARVMEMRSSKMNLHNQVWKHFQRSFRKSRSRISFLSHNNVPRFMRGVYRAVVRASLEEIQRGQRNRSEVVQIRGWKLFVHLPRILLSRSPRGGLIPRRRLEERLAQFNNEEWGVAVAVSKRRRIKKNDVELRAARAFHVCEVVKLSSARQALEREPVALSTEATRKLLTDEARRPSKPRQYGEQLREPHIRFSMHCQRVQRRNVLLMWSRR